MTATPTKEAQHLQPGDVWIHAGMVRYAVETMTPVGHLGTYVEVTSLQQGKPDNVRVDKVPARAPYEVP
ncbi:hypothetical protein [Paraburkholderia silvatlantica]|uniref:hypothetical protein n=1 Tax=Paraburkholderia silvatlantica TaxID=321895 RepID=UPI003751C1F6